MDLFMKIIKWLHKHYYSYSQPFINAIFALYSFFYSNLMPDLITNEIKKLNGLEYIIQAYGNWPTAVLAVIMLMVLAITIQGTKEHSILQSHFENLTAERNTLRVSLDDAEQTISTQRLTIIKAYRELADETLYRISIDNELANIGVIFSDEERISLYLHHNGAFILAGRHSLNPVFKSNGREKFPDNEGCIGKAWNGGPQYFNGLPDPSVSNSKYIKQAQKQTNVSRFVADKLRMKSRTYYSNAIQFGRDRIGVIVIESVKSNFADMSVFTTIIDKHMTPLADTLKQAKTVSLFIAFDTGATAP